MIEMGQTEVLQAIKALGGQATYAQIRDYLCVRGYCENSIHAPLRRLKSNRIVEWQLGVHTTQPLYRIVGYYNQSQSGQEDGRQPLSAPPQVQV